MGTFYRTIRLVENGIKPVYVFDGKPPEMKSGELSKRAERREEAQKALEKAEEAGMYISFVRPTKEIAPDLFLNSPRVLLCCASDVETLNVN
jgi:5''-3'' exonuclease (including N-terminal domain of PolI)